MNTPSELIKLYAKLTHWINVLDHSFTEEVSGVYIEMVEEKERVRGQIMRESGIEAGDLAFAEWLDEQTGDAVEFQRH